MGRKPRASPISPIHWIVDIFYNNALNHGLLLVRQPAEMLAGLRGELAARPGAMVTVDLLAQTVSGPSGTSWPFPIDAGRRKRLLLGVDAIGLTMTHDREIGAFEDAIRQRRPWMAEVG